MKIPFLQRMFAAVADESPAETPLSSFTKIDLGEDFAFMYENFIVSTQHTLCLVLEHRGEDIICLTFDFLQFQYGYPNDEAPHKFGVYGYGLFEVFRSPHYCFARKTKPHPFASRPVALQQLSAFCGSF